MTGMRRLVLVRHGQSVGNSAQRLIGSGDPALAPEGIEQMRRTRLHLVGQVIDVVVASPARRAWQSAEILTGGMPARLEADFREIDFGRWEGRTLAELEASDPIAFRQWRGGAPEFEYPGGEPRASFRARVMRGLEGLLGAPGTGALVVAHKGVVRAIVEKLTGEALADRAQPQLGDVVFVTRRPDGRWMLGVRSSNPPGVVNPATALAS
jgi:broad specificity phosphatase PhoE